MDEMKTNVIDKNKAVKYPFIGQLKSDKRLLVLFEKYQCGTVIQSDSPTSFGNTDWQIGQYEQDWEMSKFETFTGQLILEND
jgi:hypothetical protein